MRHHANLYRWLLISIRGQGPRGGVIYERRVVRHGAQFNSRKRSYSRVADLSVKPLRRCVSTIHRYGGYR